MTAPFITKVCGYESGASFPGREKRRAPLPPPPCFVLAPAPVFLPQSWKPVSGLTTGTATSAFSLARKLCSLSSHLPGGIHSFGNHLHQQHVHMFLHGTCKHEGGNGTGVRAMLPIATLWCPCPSPHHHLQGSSPSRRKHSRKKQKETGLSHLFCSLITIHM